MASEEAWSGMSSSRWPSKMVCKSDRCLQPPVPFRVPNMSNIGGCWSVAETQVSLHISPAAFTVPAVGWLRRSYSGFSVGRISSISARTSRAPASLASSRCRR